MKKFSIYYNSGEFTCFNFIAEFDDYETAYHEVVENNKYDVVYPQLIRITSL